MFFGWFYFDWTILILIPGMIFAFWAQMRVKSTFGQYEKEMTRTGRTGAEAAAQLLRANGIYDVRVERVRGSLTDHYDPRSRTLRLSESVHDSRSISAVGVACHEAGHAIQHAERYSFLQLRMSVIPVCQIGSGLAMPLFLIGLFIGQMGYIFMVAGIFCFALAALFQLITLPVEFNASARALAGMQEHRLLYEDEMPKARKVLSAAAMTYVAALASSLLSLLRLILIANRRR